MEASELPNSLIWPLLLNLTLFSHTPHSGRRNLQSVGQLDAPSPLDTLFIHAIVNVQFAYIRTHAYILQFNVQHTSILYTFCVYIFFSLLYFLVPWAIMISLEINKVLGIWTPSTLHLEGPGSPPEPAGLLASCSSLLSWAGHCPLH